MQVGVSQVIAINQYKQAFLFYDTGVKENKEGASDQRASII
jgi:hypothetical protein